MPRIGKERPATGPLLCNRRLGLQTRQKAVRRLFPLAAKVVVLSPQQLEHERPSKPSHRDGGKIAAGQPQQQPRPGSRPVVPQQTPQRGLQFRIAGGLPTEQIQELGPPLAVSTETVVHEVVHEPQSGHHDRCLPTGCLDTEGLANPDQPQLSRSVRMRIAGLLGHQSRQLVFQGERNAREGTGRIQTCGQDSAQQTTQHET